MYIKAKYPKVGNELLRCPYQGYGGIGAQHGNSNVSSSAVSRSWSSSYTSDWNAGQGISNVENL